MRQKPSQAIADAKRRLRDRQHYEQACDRTALKLKSQGQKPRAKRSIFT